MGDSMGYGGGGQSTTKGLECKPGDRGDAKNTSGASGIKGIRSPGMSGNLAGECSEGYEEAKSGWGGRGVKR